MAKLDNNPYLLEHLDANRPFLYAHLVKFERPYRLSNVVQENSNINFSTKFTKYAYITDASFNISFDDGSTYLTSASSSASNGAQLYRANKLVSVGSISEAADTKISNISLVLDAKAVDAYLNPQSIVFNAAGDHITAIDSFSDAGFQEGDLVTFKASSGSNSNKTFRINYFTNSGKTIYVTEDSDTVTTETATYSASLASSEINAILSDSNSTNFINRKVSIYKIFLNPDTPEVIIGDPILIFSGIIASAKYDESPTSASITWTLSSHWGDFQQVRGRLGADEFHRALTTEGTADPNGTLKPEYALDKGFQHANTAVNVIGVYKVLETRYKLKKKKKFWDKAGLFKKSKLKAYQVEVDREVDLRFNLSAKYIPIVYGVRRVEGIPVFADTSATNASEVYLAEVLCEGPIQGVLNVFVDDNPLICTDLADYNIRNSEGTSYSADAVDVACYGRADRGDVLSGVSSVTGTNIVNVASGLAEGVNSWNLGVTSFYDNTLNLTQIRTDQISLSIPNIVDTSASVPELSDISEATAVGGTGLTHETAYTISAPVSASIEVKVGTESQKASSLLTTQSAGDGFKIQKDYYGDSSFEDYWGPNHRLLDTAYTAQKITISSDQTTVPDFQYVVKGKLIKCYNYDGSFSEDPTRTSAAQSNFALGSIVTIRDSVTTAVLASSVTIIDKWYFYGKDGLLNYRFRWNLSEAQERSLLNSKAFYMESGANKWYMVTHDYVVGTFTVTSKLRQAVSSTANNGGDLQVVASSALSTISQWSNNSLSLVGRLDLSSSISVPNLGESYFYQPIGSIFPATVQSNTQVTLVGSSTSGISTLGGDLFIDVTNKIVLSSGASGTNDFYNGFIAKITKFLADGTTDVIYRDIIDYEVGTNKVITVFPNLQPQQIPGVNDKVEILLGLNEQDYRASNNFAIMTLDYLTSKRGGAGLDFSQVDLNSFLQAARVCDTTSDITVRVNGVQSMVIGDVYNYTSTTFKWSGKVKSFSSSNSDTFVVFTDCVGKLTNKFNNWVSRSVGDVIWDEGINSVYRITSGGVQSSISSNAALLTGAALVLSRSSGSGPASINLEVELGNPVTKYSLYDSDFIKYWKYLGWDSQDQRWVTRHQGNIELDTSSPVYSNITELLEHFNGILTFENGKYALYVETKRDADTDLWWNFQGSSESWTGFNTSFTVSDSYLSLNSTSTTPYIQKTGLSFYGYDNQIVRAKVRRVSGSGWSGTLDYLSSGKGSYGSNTVVIPDTTSTGDWTILTWNCNTRTQWTNEYVTSLRIQLGTGSADDFDIEWISVGSNSRVIEQEDILGSIAISDDGISSSFNSLSANIVDPHNNFNSRSVSFFNSTFLAEDRGVVRSTNFSLSGITNYYNARLAVEQILRRSRYGRTIGFTMRPVGLSLTPGDLIRIVYPRFGWTTGKYFRVDSLTFMSDCLVNVTAQEYNDSIYFIDSGKKSPYSIDVPAKREPIIPEAPSNLVATAYDNSPSNEEVGQIRLSWTPPANVAESANYEIFVAGILGSPETPEGSSAVKIATVPYDVTQYVDSDIQGTSRITKYYWIRTVNKVSVQTTDSIDLRDYYSDYSTYAIGTSISVEDDQAVGNSLGGSILANPMFSAATLKYDGTDYRPIGWYIKGTAESEIQYTNISRDTVKFTQDPVATSTLEVLSHVIQFTEGTSYDISIVARRGESTDQTVSVYTIEHSGQLNVGKVAMTNTAPSATYIDPEVQESTGSTYLLGNMFLTSSFQLFTFSYVPQTTSVIGGIKIVLDNNESIELDSIWLRNSGARTGVNLFDDLNTLLTGIDIRNDQLVRQNLQFINPNSSFDIPRYDGGALSYPSGSPGDYTLRPSAWYQSNGTALKPTYKDSLRDEIIVPAGSSVAGAMLRVNPDTQYEFVALVRTDHASIATNVGLSANEYTAEITAAGIKFISNTSTAEPGYLLSSRATTVVATQSVGTTYTLLSGTYNPGASSPIAKWFSPVVSASTQNARLEWFGVRDKSTFGATTGVNLFDSTGAILSDLDISNDSILGSVLGGSLLGNPTLDFAVPKTSNSAIPRPLGIFLAGNSENEISYPDVVERDTVLITRSGANRLYVLSQSFYLDPSDQYELVIIGKSAINGTVIDINIIENGSSLNSGKVTMIPATLSGYAFVDQEVQSSTGTSTSLGTITLTNSFQAFTKTFTPLPSSKVAALSIEFGTNGESMEVDSIWLRSRNAITSSAIEGSVLSNPTLQQSRIGSTGVLRPIGWFIKGTDEQEIAYSNAARSSVKFTQNASVVRNLEVISHMFRVNPATKYNITIVAKSTNSYTIDISLIEHISEFTDNTLAFTPSATISGEFIDPEIKVATGSAPSNVLSSNTISVTTSYQAFNVVYTPSSNAILGCFRFLLNDNESIEISSIWVRDASTLGATSGTDLKDEIGNILRGIDVRNDQLVKQGLEFYNPNPSFDITRYDGGSTIYPSGSPGNYTNRPAHWFQANGTSAKPSFLPGSPVDIVQITSACAMAGSILRINPDTRYEYVALMRRSNIGSSTISFRAYEYSTEILPVSVKFIGESTGEPGVLTRSQVVSLTTAPNTQSVTVIDQNWAIVRGTYIPSTTTNPKWFSPGITTTATIDIDWFGIVEKSTYGAELGSTLFDSSDRVLTDVDLKNDRLVKRALGFINENSGFDFSRDDGSSPYAPRPAAWYCSTFSSTNKPFYVDIDTRDEITIPVNSTLTSHAIRINPGDRYELSALVKATSSSATISLYIEEYDTDSLSQNQLYIGHNGQNSGDGVQTGEPGVVGYTRRYLANTPTAVGTTYALVKSSTLYVPTSTARWFSISIKTTGVSCTLDWFGVRSAATYGSRAGTAGNLFNSNGDLLLDIDIENDQVVGSVLGSSLTSNPSLDFARLSENTASPFLRPVGWFIRSSTENQIQYSNAARDTVDINGSAILCSVAFPVNIDTKYEVLIVARSDNSNVITVNMCEHTSRLAAGKLSFTNSTAGSYNDPELATSTGIAITLGTPTITNSATPAYYVYEYTPTSSSPAKLIACLNISVDSGEHIEIDQIWIRDKSTFGAKTGTSLFDSSGNLVYDGDINNDIMVGDAIGGSLLGNPSLDIARMKDVYDPTNPYRPVGWYRYGYYESDIAYADNNIRDVLRLTNSTSNNAARIMSTPFRVNTEVSYELTIIARRVNSLPNLSVYLNETSTPSPLSTGQTTFTNGSLTSPATFQDSYVKNLEGTQATIGTTAGLTTTFQAFSFTFTPLATSKWGVISIVYQTIIGHQAPQILEIDSIWLREKATEGATLGPISEGGNVYTDAGQLLQGYDLRNDALVSRTLGFLNDNAGFSFPRGDGTFTLPSGGDFALRPAAWYCSNSSTASHKPIYLTSVSYAPWTYSLSYEDYLDEVYVPAGRVMTSHAIKVNVDTKYELSALVRTYSGTANVSFYVEEYDTDILQKTQLYIGQAGGETGAATRTRTILLNTVNSVTTTFVLYNSTLYQPTSTAKWFSISVYCATTNIVLDWFGVRTASTFGATSNVNISGETFAKEDFSGNNLTNTLNLFSEVVTTGSDMSMVSTTTPIGSFAWRCGNNSGNDQMWRGVDRRRAIPVLLDKVYRVSFWIRRNSGSGVIYLGVNGFKGDVANGAGFAVNNTGANSLGSGQFYFAANGVAVPGTGWNYYESYFKKTGGSYSDSPTGTMYNPKILHPDVEYVAPLIAINYPNAAGQIDIGYVGLELVDNTPSDVISTSGHSAVVFNLDGSSNYQPKRTSAWYYTYNSVGTYKWFNGGGGTSSYYPWMDSEVTFYKGNKVYKTFYFIHLNNYGLESSGVTRINAPYSRSYWRSSTGPADDSEFTVNINGVNKNKWAGTQHISGNTYDVILSTEYGGNTSTYGITITHIATGQVISIIVNTMGVVSASTIDAGK